MEGMATDRHQAPSYPLRMPDELKARLMEVAAQSGRSLHAELLFRLERSFGADAGDSDERVQALALSLAQAERRNAIRSLELQDRIWKHGAAAAVILDLLQTARLQGVSLLKPEDETEKVEEFSKILDEATEVGDDAFDLLVARVRKADADLKLRTKEFNRYPPATARAALAYYQEIADRPLPPETAAPLTSRPASKGAPRSPKAPKPKP